MRLFSFSVTAFSALAISIGSLAGAQIANQHIRNATAVGEVFAEGEKITTAILEYDQEIDNARLSPSSFSVKDRKITRVYANSTADKAAKGANGRFVVVELDPSDQDAAILGGNRDRPAGMAGQGGPGGPDGPGGPGAQGGPGGPSGLAGSGGQSGAPGTSRAGTGMPGGGGGARKPVKLTLAQVAEIATIKGAKIPGNSTLFETNQAKNLIVDDFKQLDWKDPVTGKTVMYNLYFPKNYDKNKSYPMVLFMHDASVDSPDHDRTLIQGLGAIVWASPEDQAKHPSFVLAPQFNGGGGRPGGPGGPSVPGGANGAGQGGPNGGAQGGSGGHGLESEDQADLVYRLVSFVIGQYNIDTNRKSSPKCSVESHSSG